MTIWLFFLCWALNVLGAEETLYNGDPSLLWGPYRSNLYLGLRPRIPQSLLMGLMWSESGSIDTVLKQLRHTCEQKEGMASYGWTKYDARSGGTQVINDTALNLDLVIDLVKEREEKLDRSWELRIRGFQRKNRDIPKSFTAIFYIGAESPNSELSCSNDGVAICEGTTPGLGAFKIRVQSGNAVRASVNSLSVPQADVWKAKPFFEQRLKDDHAGSQGLRLEDGVLSNDPGSGNLQFIQTEQKGDFELLVSFSSLIRGDLPSSSNLESLVDRASSEFDERFQASYALQPPFLGEDYTRFSQAMLSNLLGAIGYFYGTSKVDNLDAVEYKEVAEGFWKAEAKAQKQRPTIEQSATELFTAVPSRSSFPRGFLWDEGFHLQVILAWDMDLALEIIDSWFNLMDKDGWIAREQILGDEARTRVPLKFQIQYPHFANPPTLFIAIAACADRLEGKIPYHGAQSRHLDDANLGNAWLANIYAKMKVHYGWFTRTQAGNMIHYQWPGLNQYIGFRWRGRTPKLTLTSGLDDYPRAQPPHPEELHVDALSWVALMANVLDKVGGYLNDTEAQEMFVRHGDMAFLSLNALHWSEADQAYCDTTIEDTTSIKHVCHKGYVSLFPFLVGLLEPDHPRLEAILLMMRDPTQLWTPYGLRSLSRQDRLYATEDNYWRSPIWVNINYMALVQLLNLAQEEGPHQSKAREVYTDLRQNIVNTVFNSWKETGYAWEQYSAENGKGQRTKHFTGWTSLVVRIMAMPDLKAPISASSPITFQAPARAWNHSSISSMFLLLALFVSAIGGRRHILRAASALMRS